LILGNQPVWFLNVLVKFISYFFSASGIIALNVLNDNRYSACFCTGYDYLFYNEQNSIFPHKQFGAICFAQNCYAWTAVISNRQICEIHWPPAYPAKTDRLVISNKNKVAVKIGLTDILDFGFDPGVILQIPQNHLLCYRCIWYNYQYGIPLCLNDVTHIYLNGVRRINLDVTQKGICKVFCNWFITAFTK
jgi:hypothetical protein